MKKYYVLAFLSINLAALVAFKPSFKAEKSPNALNRTENLILITLDGYRWQELFGGADSVLINDPSVSHDTAALKKKYWAKTAEERRKKLTPFLWDIIGRSGQMYGNRKLGNLVNCTNPFWFSYPGYSEILTGYADPAINSNDFPDNPNQTVLEFINQQAGFIGKVAAITSWDAFPRIINEKRSGVLVNSGYESLFFKNSQSSSMINVLQGIDPSPWPGVRRDVYTMAHAIEYLRKEYPRVLFVGFDGTDDSAHDGNYDQYLDAAHQADVCIRKIFDETVSSAFYRGKTTVLITTDHGRGSAAGHKWRDHGKDVPGGDQIWFAIYGPDTAYDGEMNTPVQLYQNQFAATIAGLLNLDFVGSPHKASPKIESVSYRW